jgi:hypothetical protein
MKILKRLTFSPLAWAKIRYLMAKAGKLEISGFGVSSDTDPLMVVDFYTVKQECSGMETEMDDTDLAVYMTNMAKAGIPPCRCMRIWIHSHPFADDKPNPSGTDLKTLVEKTGADSDWAVMVIMGQSAPLVRLQMRNELIGNEPIVVELDYGIAWDMIAPAEVVKGWDAEFDRNIKEANETALVVFDSEEGGWVHKGHGYGFAQGRHGKITKYTPTKVSEPVPAEMWNLYREEWGSWNKPGYPKWTAPAGNMSLFQYVEARQEGFLMEEVGKWGDLVTCNTPSALRHCMKDGKVKPGQGIKTKGKPCQQSKTVKAAGTPKKGFWLQ